MTPQLVDLNADGYQDMVMGTFEGTAFLVEGTKEGFKEPTQILDKNGEMVRISMYWDLKESEYLYVDRSMEDEPYIKEHHMTSTYVVDWDDDGDLDLLLGAYEGALYLCLNEGTKEEPVFAEKNVQVKANGEHLTIKDGLATAIVCDWNADGLFDIMCGGSKGCVYYYENVGDQGKPKFAAATKLIDSLMSQPDSSDYVASRMVPTVNGMPACPGTGFHIDAVDYDKDGDLDLLIGAQSYYQQKEKVLTDDEEEELKSITAKIAEHQKEMQAMLEGETDQDSVKELFKTEEFKDLQKKLSPLHKRREELKPSPRPANHVWLFRNKTESGAGEATYTSAN